MGCFWYLIIAVIFAFMEVYPMPAFFIMVIVIISWILVSRSNRKEQERKLEAIVNLNSDRKQSFYLTTSLDLLKIDEKNQLFKIGINSQRIFEFSELEEYRLYQDNNTVTSGQKGAAVSFGGVMLGGTTSSKSSAEVEKIDIVVTVAGKNSGRYTLNFLDTAAKQNSEKYRLAIEEAERTVSALNNILEYKEKSSNLNAKPSESQPNYVVGKQEPIKKLVPPYKDSALNASSSILKDKETVNSTVKMHEKKLKTEDETVQFDGIFLQSLTSSTYMFESLDGKTYIVDSEQNLTIIIGMKVKFSGMFVNESEIGSSKISIVKLVKLESVT